MVCQQERETAKKKKKKAVAVLIKSILYKGTQHCSYWKFAARQVDQLSRGKLEFYMATLQKVKGSFDEAKDWNQSNIMILPSYRMHSLKSLTVFYFIFWKFTSIISHSVYSIKVLTSFDKSQLSCQWSLLPKSTT